MSKHIITFIIFSILLLPVIISAAPNDQEGVIINTYQADITGDRILEDINLKGTPFSEDSDYFHNIWAEVISKGTDDGRWKLPYGDGYEPSIQFIDINHDNIKDILYQSPTGGSGGLYHYELHTISNNRLLEIPLPKQEYVSGSFADNFIAEISISPNEKPIKVDISNRREEYIRHGIYNKKGKLLKEKSLIIDPIANFKPVELSERKGYGLKSFKQISGVYHEDPLGNIEAIWYYNDGKWVILKTDWKQAKPQVNASS